MTNKQIIEELKAEVKSKTEYIQEQREIIDQYSKEIEMYKKCQGKRASKREEELKADNKHLNDLLDQALKELEESREAIEKIKEICKTNVCKHCHSKLKVDDNYCKNIKDCDCYNILRICDEVND